jgi:hypothetical protein
MDTTCTSFKFENYDLDELRQCGHAFERTFAFTSLEGNRQWTPGVLEWFRQAAPASIRVYPAAGMGSKGEFLVDLCHTTYAHDDETDGAWPSLQWYERTCTSPCQIKLALESEWGKWGYGDQSLVMVLDDACKLAVLRASVKVMIFSSHWKDDTNRVTDALQNLRRCHADTSPWLWLDVPNDPAHQGGMSRVIRCGTFHG